MHFLATCGIIRILRFGGDSAKNSNSRDKSGRMHGKVKAFLRGRKGMEGLQPTNLSREQIYTLAEKFAEVTYYTPGETDIIEYVKKQLHGKIEYTDSPKDSAGGSISVDARENFTIFLSKSTSHKRDIFTIAHELGHYFLHSRLGTVKLKANRSEDIDEAEKEANSFAAAFLMPATKLRKLYEEKEGNISALAEAFNVSLSAMNWRCINLKLKQA